MTAKRMSAFKWQMLTPLLTSLLTPCLLQHLNKQVELLRQVNDQHAKVYEQLDVSARELEQSNRKLVQENRAAQQKTQGWAANRCWLLYQFTDQNFTSTISSISGWQRPWSCCRRRWMSSSNRWTSWNWVLRRGRGQHRTARRAPPVCRNYRTHSGQWHFVQLHF